MADVYLLPELRRQCGQLIGECLDEAGACSALRVARLLRLHRLEEQCIDFMARHLAQVGRVFVSEDNLKKLRSLAASCQ